MSDYSCFSLFVTIRIIRTICFSLFETICSSLAGFSTHPYLVKQHVIRISINLDFYFELNEYTAYVKDAFSLLLCWTPYSVSMITSWSAFQSSLQPFVYVNQVSRWVHSYVIQESWNNLISINKWKQWDQLSSNRKWTVLAVYKTARTLK